MEFNWLALPEGDVYVLKWAHANGGPNEGWRQRVWKTSNL
jgi:hypothetical protein